MPLAFDSFSGWVHTAFYCDRDFNRRTAEKHLFRMHELSEFGGAHRLSLRFFPNATLSDYVAPILLPFESFSVFSLNYLQSCMFFDGEFLRNLRRHPESLVEYIDDCYRSHVRPTIMGVFLLKKADGWA